MKLLYGTGNPAKLEAMRRRLSVLGIEILGLNDIQMEVPKIIEDGNTPLENARKKAIEYYRAFHMPVFSCDSGLYMDNIPEEEQPGVHVRTINGKVLSDDEMLEHYISLVKKYGNLTARYRNAICLVLDEEHIYEAMEESMASEPFILTSVPHAFRKEGFPLDSISLDIKTGKYYYDLPGNGLDQVAVEEGFLSFFKEKMKMMVHSSEQLQFENKNTYTYKRATIEDIDELVRTRLVVLRAANQLSEHVDMLQVEKESYDYYKKALVSGEHVAYLVYDGDIFIGAGGVSFYQVMPTYHNPSGKKAYIMNMYTDPKYRRQGIAMHTLDLLVNEAKEKGIEQISLEATDVGRPLYEKYGFVAMECEMEL